MARVPVLIEIRPPRTRTFPFPIWDTRGAFDTNKYVLEEVDGKAKVIVYARGYARAWVKDVGHERGPPTGRSKLVLAPRARADRVPWSPENHDLVNKTCCARPVQLRSLIILLIRAQHSCSHRSSARLRTCKLRCSDLSTQPLSAPPTEPTHCTSTRALSSLPKPHHDGRYGHRLHTSQQEAATTFGAREGEAGRVRGRNSLLSKVRLLMPKILETPNSDLRARYSDDEYEYRHVQLPKQMLKVIPKDYFDSRGTLKLLWEEEWRALGITQVRGCLWSNKIAHWLT
jgi:hypothetical protein